jgi:hypothetical protein
MIQIQTKQWATIRNACFIWRGWKIHLLDFIILSGIAIVLFLTNYLDRDIDIYLYANYASGFMNSRTLPVEYPPLSIIPFLFTRFPFADADPYAQFNCWITLIMLLSYVVILQYTTRKIALFTALYIFLGGFPEVLRRYDILPALFVLFALFAVKRQRFGLAYCLLAIGMLLKVYPAFCFVLVAIAQYQHLANSTVLPEHLLQKVMFILRKILIALSGAIGLIVVVITTAIGVSGFENSRSFLTYATQRPTQVESIGGSAIWIVSTLLHIPYTTEFSYGSINWNNEASLIFGQASFCLLIGGIVLVSIALIRHWLSISTAFLALICVVILTNKVFSTQYLVWVLPFVAEVAGIDILWIAICLLTAFDMRIYPLWPFTSLEEENQFMALVALRNGLLIIATIRLFFQQRNDKILYHLKNPIILLMIFTVICQL